MNKNYFLVDDLVCSGYFDNAASEYSRRTIAGPYRNAHSKIMDSVFFSARDSYVVLQRKEYDPTTENGKSTIERRIEKSSHFTE